jgi:peroxiredoxin
MRKLLKPIVIIPALLGIVLSFWVFVKIREKQKFEATLKRAVSNALSSGPLPKGSLIHLEDRTDYYETVGRGRVLLVFLTTDCGACNKEVRTMSKTLPRIPTHLNVYGVFFENRDKVTKFTRENMIQFPVLLDKGGQIFNGLRLRHFPAKILIEDGVIVKTWVGSSSNEDSLLKEIS